MNRVMSEAKRNALIRMGLLGIPKADVPDALINATPENYNKFRVLRENVFNLSRVEFAKLLGISSTTYKNWELEYRTPDIMFMSNLLGFLSKRKELHWDPDFVVNRDIVTRAKAESIVIALIDININAVEFLKELQTLNVPLKAYNSADYVARANNRRQESKEEKEGKEGVQS